MGIEGTSGNWSHVVIVPYDTATSFIEQARGECKNITTAFDGLNQTVTSLKDTISQQASMLENAQIRIKSVEASLREGVNQLKISSPALAKLEYLMEKIEKTWSFIQPIASHPAFLAATGLSTLYCGYKTVQTLFYPGRVGDPLASANRSSWKWLAGTILSASACTLSIYARTT